MECPQCQGYQLEPCELEVGLIACRCQKCQGTLLPLMNYRYWADQHPEVECETPDDDVIEESTQTKLCPKCSRFMTKFKIGSDSDNRLELCTSCDEVWLDSGEWGLLKKLNLYQQLSRIFTDAWQRNIRIQKQRETLKKNYQKALGQEKFNKVDDFKQWLDDQSERGEILQYLTTKIQ